MKALIFAAGRGERMRPLSDRTPKPLLVAGGRMLIEWQITALVAAGIRELVINTSYHAQGDMGIEGPLATMRPPRLTYANIAVFAPRVFAGQSSGRKRLFPWAFGLVEQQRASAERFRGRWYNVGTPQDLAALDMELHGNPLAGA